MKRALSTLALSLPALLRVARPMVLLLVAAAPALARVGGGESYAGDSSSSSSSGDSGGLAGDLETIFYLIQLCAKHPKIGLPLTAIVVMLWVYRAQVERSQTLEPPRDPPLRRRSQTLDTSWDLPLQSAAAGLPWSAVRAHDPDFSRPVLMEFLGRLCVRYRMLHGERQVDVLAPYLAPPLLEQLRAESRSNCAAGRTVVDVVIGSMTVRKLTVEADGALGLNVRYEFNFGLRERDGTTAHYFCRQAWRLDRPAGARSPTPEGARALGCPNCGAPVDAGRENRCAHCGSVLDAGKFTWRVTGVVTLDRRPRHSYNPALQGGQEEGTDLPDVVDPCLFESRAEFERRYPGFDWSQFETWGRGLFERLQAVWSSGQWQHARPFETDGLFSSHRFHLEGLARRGLTNRIEEVQVTRWSVVRIESDKHYDAVTARIHAGALDYTIDPAGTVVAGSKERPRSFSEYWTFLRAAGYQEKGPQADLDHCPNCGAPIAVSQAGECEHCRSTITTGTFGWVLASIEQDEAYTG